jgi:O-antigen ligase
MSTRIVKSKPQASAHLASAAISKPTPDLGIFFISLYLLVHFIPNYGSVDVIGSQWLALSLLNLVVVGFILVKKNHYLPAIANLTVAPISILYFLLICWAAASYFYAINEAEVLVNFARLFNTAVVFLNIGILLWNRRGNFITASYFITAILLFESLSTMKVFFTGLYTSNFDELILSLKGNTGNKNIMAAALAIKLPFVFYAVYNSGKLIKSIGALALLTSIFSIAVINARATYLSVVVCVILVTVFSLIMYLIKSKKEIKHLVSLAYILIPIVLGFVSAQIIVSGAQAAEAENASAYGTVMDRVSTINLSDASSSGRVGFWKDAIDFTSKHPIFGGGLGNWKLASIPYAKEKTDELIVPYHAHNDFFEIMADLGIPGVIMFVGLFVLLLFYAFRHWQSDASYEIKYIVIFSLIALVAYFFDAFLNFPSERPATQILFSFIMASIVVPYLNLSSISFSKKFAFSANIYPYLTILILLPVTYISFLTYTSMKGQMFLMREANSEAKEPLEVIATLFPAIPNISVTTLPIESMKARYYYRDKKYDEALALLDKGAKANPYIYYSEFLKAALYFSTDKMDSAYKYGKLSFYNWPRASNYYRNLIAILGKQKDTTEIKKAFATYVKYRNEPFAWNTFLMGMLQSKGKGDQHLLMLADSALKQFPGDTNIVQRRKEIFGTMQSGIATSGVTQNSIDEANRLYLEGSKLFSQKSYSAAAQKFIRAASLNPGNYAFFENAGICYYASNQFNKAILYFDKAIKLGTSASGKSEYFKAVSLVNLGRKDEGCALAKIAKERKYPDADSFIQSNCK